MRKAVLFCFCTQWQRLGDRIIVTYKMGISYFWSKVWSIMGICLPYLLVTADEIVKPEAKFFMSHDQQDSYEYLAESECWEASQIGILNSIWILMKKLIRHFLLLVRHLAMFSDQSLRIWHHSLSFDHLLEVWYLMLLSDQFHLWLRVQGSRGSIVGWGTMLQAGRSRDRVPMRWIFFQLI
jgi:hypothetical protein